MIRKEDIIRGFFIKSIKLFAVPSFLLGLILLIPIYGIKEGLHSAWDMLDSIRE